MAETTPSADTQDCEFHKITHKGSKRATFQKEQHDALLNATMGISIKLQKEVIWNCDCPTNQAKLDGIIEEMKEPKS